jgi:hypothetical protein
MHAFENSQNQSRRENNWSQLHLFFKKFPLRDVHITAEEYGLIVGQKDHKAEQLYQFVCRLYSICTKRNLPENAPVLDVPPVQANNPNLTASYLLKEDGLEKLDNSGQLSNSRGRSQVEQSRVEDKPADRVPTRKIVPTLESGAGLVDVTGIAVRTENRKVTSKRKSWEIGGEDDYVRDSLFSNSKTGRTKG